MKKLAPSLGLSENDFGRELLSLSGGYRMRAKLLHMLGTKPDLMLLDEPMAGLGQEDIKRISALIRQVARNRTVLMVEHNMNVVSSIADTISVLQRGQVIAEGPYAQVSTNPQVLEAYMGSAQTELEGAHG